MRQFPIAREGVPFILMAGIPAGFSWLLGARALTLAFGGLAVGMAWFFRNPTREIPQEAGTIVSPADGRVMEIQEEEEGTYFRSRVRRVSIFLSIFDVHMNWIPYSGQVIQTGVVPGEFFSAMTSESSKHNHRHALFIQTDEGRKVLVVQIAGLIARRISCWVKAGDRVVRGERFGLIRFGSRVDTFLPLDATLRVSVGDKVRGGSSIIGEFT